MTDNAVVLKLKNLVLVRMLGSAKGSETVAKVSKDLAPLAEHRWVGSEWASLIESALAALAGEGAIRLDKKGKSTAVVLLDAGRRRALDYLGVGGLPPKTTWGKLKNVYLVARAMDIPLDSADTLKRMNAVGGLRGAILREAYGLPVGRAPTQKQALDALLWKQLGVDTDRFFGLAAVKERLLGQVLGVDAGMTAAQLSQAIPAKAVGARRDDAANLRLAVLQRILSEPERPPAKESQSLEQFAAAALAAARGCSTGRFGEHKVFIARAYDAFQAAHSELGYTLESFKTRLTEANHANLLALARADLVQAMDPADVARSETRYLNAQFHFINLEEGA